MIIFQRIGLLIILLFCILTSSAQDVKDNIPNMPIDTIAIPQHFTKRDSTVKKNYGLAKEVARTWRNTERKVRKEIKKMNAIDTTYIAPNKYNLAFMLERSFWYENCSIGGITDESRQNITFAPNPDKKLGIYFGWRWIFLGYTFDLKDVFGKNKKKTKNKKEFELSIYSSRLGVDLYWRKTGSNFKIRSTSGFELTENEKSDLGDFNGLECNMKGLNAYWIFNYKKFSYPAVYSQSTNQRKNAGSLMVGFSYTQNHYIFDYTQLPMSLLGQLNNAMMISEEKYANYSINIGYGYNWVFAKNCVVNLSLSPAIAYKKAKSYSNEEDEIPQNILKFKWLKQVNLDLIGRTGIVWNNSKYFVGGSVLFHSYNYKRESFSVTNNYITARIYAGFNFWKRK